MKKKEESKESREARELYQVERDRSRARKPDDADAFAEAKRRLEELIEEKRRSRTHIPGAPMRERTPKSK
ncbi:hypothetical protein KW785_00990 [Candidatus Parcubacteria bacterium]|nr:hypothetical protein [Candidatus Parcubacteria bacterium]